MSRVVAWLVRRVGVPMLLVWCLISAAFGSVAWSLSQIVRGLDFELLGTIILLGAITGWLFARTRLRGRFVLPLAIVIGSSTVLVRVGQLGSALIELGNALWRFFWETQFRVFQFAPVLATLEALRAGVMTLVTRVEVWGRASITGQPTFDPVATALVWSVILWCIAFWFAWRVRRAARPFDALLPLTALVAIVLAYSERDAWVMFFIIAAWLGLLVIIPHWTRMRRWKTHEIPFAENLGADLAFIGVPAISAILFLTIIMPALSPREIVRWVQQWNQSATAETSNIISNSFGVAPAPRAVTILDEFNAPGLPRSHLLGARPELLEALALTIETDAQSPAPYWLGNTYDEYTGRGWFTSVYRLQNYSANESAMELAAPFYRTIQQTVRVENPSGLVYAVGILARVDHAYQVAWRANADFFGATVDSNVYRVESRALVADAAQLRAAGNNYPDWIRAQYLELPNDMPPRVLALARDLTATAPTGYDRAQALEAYLRTISYTLDVPEPPINRDVADYFLFDLKRGYCDYYATAMVVLARAAGLPARLAVGYATGEYDVGTGQYRVKQKDAHSWTQIYFPEYGWVDFEPTSGRAVLARDFADALPYPPPQPRAQSDFIATNANRVFHSAWLIVPGSLLFLALAALLLLLVDAWRLQLSGPAYALERIYQRLRRAARHLGVELLPGHTPTQVAAMLDAYFVSAEMNRLASFWQPVRKTIPFILQVYVETMFGGRVINRTEQAKLIRHWQTVAIRIWLAIVLYQFRRRIILPMRCKFVSRRRSLKE